MYVAFVTLFVNDQNRTKKFYVEKLGFEERLDVPIGDGLRWVTLGLTGEKTEVVLSAEGFPGWSTAKVGVNTGGCLEVDDIFAEHQKLSAKGVEFTDGPRMEFFGGWASFKDCDGNEWGLHSPVRDMAASVH